MNSIRKTGNTISEAVSSYINENSASLDNVTVNLISEKTFTDRSEYTVELGSRNRPEGGPREITEEEISYAEEILSKLVKLMYFKDTSIERSAEGPLNILRIKTRDKDGLIIGKNGQNLDAMQYLLSMALDKQFHRHVQVIVDVDAYREKRVAYLKSLSKTLAEKAKKQSAEVITEYLPSYERKIIHEEVSGIDSLKTFSVGRGPYKKVVITSLL